MILTTHSIVGAGIVNLFPNNPAVGFGLSLASHYLLDMIPHKDYEVGALIDNESRTVKSFFNNFKSFLHLVFVGVDFFAGVILCILIYVRDEKTAYLTALGVLGGVLPDFFQLLYLKYKNRPLNSIQKVHDHVHNRAKPITGYLSQFLTVIIFVSLYFLFK